MHSGRTDAQRRGPARVVLRVVMGQVEIGVGAIEDDDVEAVAARIAGFDRDAIARTKSYVDEVT